MQGVAYIPGGIIKSCNKSNEQLSENVISNLATNQTNNLVKMNE